MKNADPYPLMFSTGATMPLYDLPEWYQGDCKYQYSNYDKDDHFYNDSNFFGNPFEDDFKSKRENEEEEDNNYSVLGLKKSASQEDIKSAFRGKARETHPDKGGDPDEFRKIREAYECLIS